jgi:hypothetical protein
VVTSWSTQQPRIAYARPQRRDDRPPVGVLLIALERAARGGGPS